MKKSIAGFPMIGLLVFCAGCFLKPLPREVKKTSDLEYGNVHGRPLLLDLYTPKNQTGKIPVLIWIHGGAWKNGSKKRCPIAFMATQNVAVVSIDYRLSHEAPFPAPLHDCKGAVRWLRAHAEKYQLDSGHIGIFGVSSGGHLAALLGTTGDAETLEGNVGGNLNFSSKVQAVCALYPATDLNQLVTNAQQRISPKNDAGRLLGGTVESKQDVAALANPIRYVSKNSAPFFLVHGDEDKIVPLQQSRILYGALKDAGVDATLEILRGKGHGAIPNKEVAMGINTFFQKYLPAKKSSTETQK